MSAPGTPGAATSLLGEMGDGQQFQQAQAGQASSSEALVAVPLGIFGQLLGGIGQALGGAIGGSQGAQIGGAIGSVAGQFVPFQVIPPAGAATVGPQSAYGQQAQGQGESEALVAVPLGLISSLISAGAGQALGGAFAGRRGARVGAKVGTFLGSLSPFQVIPPSGAAEVGPQSASEQQSQTQGESEALVAVPMGILTGLLGSAGVALGRKIGGRRGAEIGGTIGGLLGTLSPFQVIPPTGVAAVGPQSMSGQQAQAQGESEALVAVPMGILSSLIGTGLGQRGSYLAHRRPLGGLMSEGPVSHFQPFQVIAPEGVAA